ncbi:MAG: acetyl-CoA decarbonylase/synthase complex subunit delta, partial [Candidatus Bipolaricaulia bacterium]
MTVEIPDVKKSWPSQINTVTIGATPEEGGTRAKKITVGGETTLPFYHFEGEIPHPPVVAMEVWDVPPEDWPELVKEPFAEAVDDPGEWAKRCVEYGADLV